MKFLADLHNPNDMTTSTAADEEKQRSESSEDSPTSLIDISSLSLQPQPNSPNMSDFEHVSQTSLSLASSVSPDKKAKLLYCKSHVSIHPTQFNRDNISGYLGVVEVEAQPGNVVADDEGGVKSAGSKELLVTWVPDELLARMDEEDREGYKRVEGRSLQPAKEKEEDGFVFVSLPPPKGETYAFSVPLSNIYSILVYPPSLSHWYGSATINLLGGVSLPTLFFHDDESPLLPGSRQGSQNDAQTRSRSQWGFPPFVALLETRATMLKSRLVTPRHNQGGELWLVNPSKSDRDVHDTPIEEPKAMPDRRQSAEPNATVNGNPYPPRASLPDVRIINQSTPRQTLMTGLSNITNFSRKAAQQIMSHPLAQPVVPHLPPAVRSLVNVPGEWERSGRFPPKGAKNNDVASEFESARLYLARWARVVAEEGERARREELAAQAGLGRGRDVPRDMTSTLGVFSLLTAPGSKRPTPKPTRTPELPITRRDWDSLAAQGRDELFIRREIFKRGFTDSPEPDQQEARREGWAVLLGIVPWGVGGVGGGEIGKKKRFEEREKLREEKRAEYERLKGKWKNDGDESRQEEWKEEWHRIDVDCRRTDRTQSIFAIPTTLGRDGEKEAAADKWDGKTEAEEGGAAPLNPHIAALRTILMTYHTYSPELGYVQGMSDLLSPIYVVFDANEADAFWGLVGVMRMMESNFLRDQSGMKRQLSTLQQLIGVMDPELYAYLERTDSLNLFFCFRWILIAFKREFKFEDVIRLWEVLWTNYYSDHFVLFVALAILQSHRDVLLRYLTEFDEVLKYANDLSGTIDLDTTLAQAEVLFVSFRNMVQDVEANPAAGEGGLRRRRGSLGGGVEVDGGRKRVSEQLRELLEHWEPSGLE
ncbi:rab-GTPase-TBC domain-containing protein [Naematelia encephala]|uniref:Rab-GTPase-TBC domain-containing protein n=1 Tax=Naematelia encephala TaxID=71784 RepID=A0A1Y2B0D6_9TREE|nr:rab-GTPase-TBC domain-containing protein [Naematelia encephala]